MEGFMWIKVFYFVLLMLQLTAAAGQTSHFTVRHGDEVTLPSDCAQEVRDEDAGLYICRQFDTSGHQQGQYFSAYLSVVNITEVKNNNKVTLSCSVTSCDRCRHTVKWLQEEKDIIQNNNIKTSQSDCSASLTFTPPHVYTSKSSESFMCRVKQRGNMEEFIFRISPLTDETGWWKFVVGPLAFTVLLILLLVVVKWRRAKGNKTQMSEDADPEDVVQYASISYTKKPNRKPEQVLGKSDDDDDDKVAYSCVKAPSSSDPNNLYASVNKSKK
ncbi:uncharacterized protein LOC106537380 isoform X2 [Austrofundulus limnaeus]|uniref:Uncharacterized protein LOC106537380 isoform X2 n=1 Tax=Austrofundulus limnaeus TaxID=52670 RepID=A0A2I4DDA0_AUSLI|nr:PREDICTED: uncharacterized protein LOC106537380 isoform X2 [Austrofundulus limnaeus]